MTVIHCVKIGGGLSYYPEELRNLMKFLDNLSKSWQLLILPGGGPFADIVRDMYRQYNLSETAAHWMAILAIDQYGFFLSNLSENAVTTPSIDEAKELAKKNKFPILLPFRLLYEQDPLEHSWDVTSDSIAVYIATLIDAESLIILKDVEGIFECDPEKETSTLIRKVNRHDFATFEMQECVDKYFPKILAQSTTRCWVLNGREPSRISAVLEGHKPIGTEIL